MPNHVTNIITISGPTEIVTEVKNLLIPNEDDSDGFTFQNLLPRPSILDRMHVGSNGLLITEADDPIGSHTRELTEEEKIELEKYAPYKDWYEWNIGNWGTKWDAYEYRALSDVRSISFSIDTAWSPPTPVLDTISRKYPDLNVETTWFDEGWCHAGDGVLKPGSNISSDSFYKEPSDALYEKVYGKKPETDVDYPPLDVTIPEDIERIIDNFTCEDVASASDDDGYYDISGTMWSDDWLSNSNSSSFTDDIIFGLRKYRENLHHSLNMIK